MSVAAIMCSQKALSLARLIRSGSDVSYTIATTNAVPPAVSSK